jgi:tetratricopeptide (TPR) repeat protein
VRPILRPLALAALAALGVLAAGGPAPAQAQGDADAFRAAVARATELFEQEAFSEARAEYQRAYALHPEPTLLFNVATTYRREGAHAEALEAYRRYLEAAPEGHRLRGEATTYAREMEVLVEKELARDRERAAAAGAAAPDASGQAGPGGPDLVAAPPPTTVDRGRRLRRTGAFVAFGTAGAAAGGAITFGVLGLRAVDRKDREPTEENAARVRRFERLTNVSWALAGAAAVTGGVLFYLSRPSPSGASEGGVSAGVAPLPGGAAAILSGRF